MGVPDPLPPAEPQQIVSLMKTLAARGPAKDRAEFTRLLEESRPVFDYMERQPAIESASAVLEAHRDEFIKLTKRPDALMKRAQTLFAEERFAPLSFTAADVQRAFDHVGHPSFGLIPDDRTVALLRAAILHTADKPQREEMAMALLMHLPDLVAENRFLDGWIIQHCAHETTEAPDESNPFLFAMFTCGYEAWTEEKRSRSEAFAHELGFDPAQLRNMSPTEIDALLAKLKDDPAVMAKLEAYMEANPGERTQANASLDAMDQDSIELLKREDAAHLLLTPEDLEPWLPVLNEWLADIVKRYRPPGDSGPMPPEVAQQVADELWPLLGEMAEDIFTSERIQQLREQIIACRDELYAAGDKQIISQTLGAINQLNLEGPPSENYFLQNLCYFSLNTRGRKPEAGGD